MPGHKLVSCPTLRRTGDEQRERYYYGVMFGLETARDERAAIVAAMIRESTTPRQN